MNPAENRWIARPRRSAAPRLRLICFPHVGAGAAAFNSWLDHLPEDVELCAVRPPGRENRLREPLVDDGRELLDRLEPVVAPLLDVPFVVVLAGWVLLGLGAGVAFQAINLFVMGRAAPGTEGRATSSVQLANTIGAAVGTSALGGLLNAGRDGGLGMAQALLLVFAVCWAVLVLSTVLAWGGASSRDTQAVTAAG